MSELIERSNSIKFYHDCDFNLESTYFDAKKKLFELTFSINQASYDVPIEYEEWKIKCEETIDFRGFNNKILLPYIKIEIIEKHPLLLEYQEGKTDFFIKNAPLNLNEFYGEISMILEKEFGNWIKLDDLFWNLEDCFIKDKEKYLAISDSLLERVKTICGKYNIHYRSGKRQTGKDLGFYNKPNSKLLIFGNTDVCPNHFNFKQHYVIAENFEFERIK